MSEHRLRYTRLAGVSIYLEVPWPRQSGAIPPPSITFTRWDEATSEHVEEQYFYSGESSEAAS